MYGCEVLYDAETAERVKAQVRGMMGMGGQCPCDRDQPCPLLPENPDAIVLPLPTVGP